MKYASYQIPGQSPTWGVVDGDRIQDLGPTGLQVAASLREAIRDGKLPAESVSGADHSVAAGDVTLLPVIPDPNKVICIGVNYVSHQKETGRTEQKAPTVFVRFADSQMGHEAPAVKPSCTTQFDYEGEVAVVIGREAYRVSEDSAMEFVAGYSIYNDFTVRDWQRATTQWTPGKNFPDTGAFGPYFVPSEDIEDISTMRLETRVNGEVRQSATLADLYFSIPELIAHVTTFTRLSPGDVIVTGTPGGVGLFMDPPGLLDDGDVVEVEVTNLGVLRNTVKAEQ